MREVENDLSNLVGMEERSASMSLGSNVMGRSATASTTFPAENKWKKVCGLEKRRSEVWRRSLRERPQELMIHLLTTTSAILTLIMVMAMTRT
jgi:hypothetical protein